MSYTEFLERKRLVVRPCGIDLPPPLSPQLFPFQRDITRWALRIGKAAVWADCGLGKSWIAIEWARCVAAHAAKPVLILTPLAVAQQFVAEADKIDVRIEHLYVSKAPAQIRVCNYEKLHRIDVSEYGGVVLDESSVLKDYTSKTRNQLIDSFALTPYKLCCTATPAPNDFVELGNHAEFLGAMTRAEMLAMFFVHDGGSTQDWRIKGHAEADFWQWLSSWAINLKTPSDLGYDDDGYDLPPLDVRHHVVEADSADVARQAGLLFAAEARTLSAQRAARRVSLPERVALCAEMVNASDEPWIVWCDLNAESSALAAAIPDAVEVAGRHDTSTKESRMWGFSRGEHRVLVTKPSIAGHGMNWQHCARVAFVGVSHSFEQWYQAIRRCWRFGQGRPVGCHVITSEQEGAIVDNLKRKQDDAERLTRGMVAHMAELSCAQLGQTKRTETAYEAQQEMRLPQWM